MKKNLLKVAAIPAILLTVSSGMIAFAAGYERSFTKEVTAITPKFGAIVDVREDYSGKYFNDENGTIWTTYQKTSLKHQIRLAYLTVSNTLGPASDWATAEVDKIKRPSLSYYEQNRPYFSQAKSHNFEPTNNTMVKYKFSADNM